MNKAVFTPFCNALPGLKLPAFLALIASLLLPATALAQSQDPVGVIKFARGSVTVAAASGQTRDAGTDDELMQGERIETGPSSIAVILLSDDSRMVLRPNSEFRVNQMNIADDEDSPDQSAVLNLLRGGLRLVTGLIGRVNPGGYRLSTPVATIGIRGTEFNTRLCEADCTAEESQLGGGGSIDEGLYVNVDDGGIFVQNFGVLQPLELDQGQSGYVADLNTPPVTLSAIPAFLALDRIPSPSVLDFDNIDIPDIDLESAEAGESDDSGDTGAAVAGVAVGAVAAVPAAGVGAAGVLDVAGTYEIDDIDYSSSLPIADRRLFFGANPDIEFTLTQDGDNIRGEFEGDRDGQIFAGKIDGNVIELEFTLEARGGDLKEGAATLTVEDNGNLTGDWRVRDQARGVVRGRWELEKTD